MPARKNEKTLKTLAPARKNVITLKKEVRKHEQKQQNAQKTRACAQNREAEAENTRGLLKNRIPETSQRPSKSLQKDSQELPEHLQELQEASNKDFKQGLKTRVFHEPKREKACFKRSHEALKHMCFTSQNRKNDFSKTVRGPENPRVLSCKPAGARYTKHVFLT